MPAVGLITGPAELEWLQLQSDSAIGYAIEPGFSGAPVWDDQLGAVVGIVVSRDRRRGDSGDPRTGYCIPTETLAAYCPELPFADPGGRPYHGYLPPLPHVVVPRDADVRRVVSLALRESDPTAERTRTLVLHGMGGIGKTVLAALVARDASVRRAFSDGIIWVEVGAEADLLARQRELAAAMGLDISTVFDWRAARAALADTLRTRRILLVVDNVWSSQDAAAFDVLGPRGVRIVTSRRSSLVDGAEDVAVDVLPADSARQLLLERAGDVPASAGAVAELLEECAGLPLALAATAAMVARVGGWDGVLQRLRHARLDRISLTIQDYAYRDLLAALLASVSEIENVRLGSVSLRRCYLNLVVFSGVPGPYPITALRALWASEGLDEVDVLEALDLLDERSLLFRDLDGNVTLHDLQLDLLSTLMAGNTADSHQQLLAGYQGDQPWATVPDDGYLYHHLVHHLVQADRTDEAINLAFDLDWLVARATHREIPLLVGEIEVLVEADRELSTLAEALRLTGAPASPGELIGQLTGRVVINEGDTKLTRLLEAARVWTTQPWLCPVAPTLALAGGPLRRSLNHGAAMWAVSVNWDSRGIVSIGGDGTVKRWAWEGTDALASSRLHRTPRHVLGITPNGGALVLYIFESEDESERLLLLEDLANSRVQLEERANVYRAALSRDGRWAAWTELRIGDQYRRYGVGYAVSEDDDTAISTLTLFRIDTGERWTNEYAGRIEEVLFNRSGERLVCRFYSGRITSTSVATKAETEIMDEFEDHEYPTTILPADGLAVLFAVRQNVYLLPERRKIITTEESSRWLLDIALSDDGTHLAAISSDDRLLVWDLRSGRLLQALKLPAPTGALQLSPDGRDVVTGDAHGSIIWWHVDGQTETLEQGREVNSLATCLGDTVLGTEWHGDLKAWSMENPQETRVIAKRIGSPAALTPDARYLVLGDDYLLRRIECSWGDADPFVESIAAPARSDATYHNVRVSSDGSTVIALWSPGSIEVWSPADSVVRLVDVGHYSHFFLSPDGQYFVTVRKFLGTGATLWNVTTGKAVAEFAAMHETYTACLSQDASIVAVSYSGGCELRCVTSQGTVETVIVDTGTQAEPASSALSTDGSWLALGYQDGWLCLFDVRSRQMAARFRNDAEITAILFAEISENVDDHPTIVLGDSRGKTHVLTLR